MVTPPLIYVAAPYNDPDPVIVQRRMETVTYELAVLASKGSVAFSPLLMHFCLNTGIELPSDYNFWENFCLTMLSKSDALVVLTLPGWVGSSGVQSEISFAKDIDIPISYQTPKQNDYTNSTSSI
jgi:hypothetical protein